MAFPELLGHDRIKDLLARSLVARRLPPALLLTGPDGIGKKMMALAVGRALLCPEAELDRSCGSCTVCSRAQRGIHPDLMLVQPEKAGAAIKIEQVRALVREVTGRPFEASARLFVLDEAHLMTEPAANALLKSLEEPPATSHLFLVTAAPHALLPTIRSRCQVLRFNRLPVAVLEAHLVREAGLSEHDARLRAVVSEGSLAAALAFESDTYRGLRDELLATLEAAEGAGPLARMQAAERLAEREDLQSAMTLLRALLRDVAVLNAGGDSPLNADVTQRLTALAGGALGPRATDLVAQVGRARGALRANANRLLCMDLLLDVLAGKTPVGARPFGP